MFLLLSVSLCKMSRITIAWYLSPPFSHTLTSAGWKDEKGNGIHGAQVKDRFPPRDLLNSLFQSEYIRIPQAQGSLYKLSPDLNPEEGLLLGDILSTAIYAAAQAGVAGWHPSGNSVRSALSLMASIQQRYEDNDGKFAEVYGVVGVGPVGLLVVAAIRTFLLWRGVAPEDILIFAIDTVSERLAAASRWGATPMQLSPADPSSEERILTEIREASLTRGRSGQGVDAVVECVGSSSAVSLAYKLLAPGGTLSSVGVHSTSFPITPADIYDKNVTYRSGRCPARSLMPVSEHMLRWLRCPEMRVNTQGEGLEDIRLTDIITHRMGLEEISTAYQLFDQKLEGCLKPVIYPHGLP
jgi:threonine dehydrogenase-like Zn-dependent dehydrogenase